MHGTVLSRERGSKGGFAGPVRASLVAPVDVLAHHDLKERDRLLVFGPTRVGVLGVSGLRRLATLGGEKLRTQGRREPDRRATARPAHERAEASVKRARFFGRGWPFAEAAHVEPRRKTEVLREPHEEREQRLRPELGFDLVELFEEFDHAAEKLRLGQMRRRADAYPFERLSRERHLFEVT